jgi:hypothetical protein
MTQTSDIPPALYLVASIGELATALAAAQAEMKNAVLNKVNPHYKSKYADLTSVREATLSVLNKHGLALVQYTTYVDGQLLLRTELLHKSGQFISSAWPIVAGTPQQMGSAYTYARRYGWTGICGIAAEDDDDANAAEGLAPPKNKSAHKARKDGDWERLLAEMNLIETEEGLRKWWTANMSTIMDLPDNWKKHLREAKEAKKIELTEGVSEDGKLSMRQRLQASVNAEEAE